MPDILLHQIFLKISNKRCQILANGSRGERPVGGFEDRFSLERKHIHTACLWIWLHEHMVQRATADIL